MFTLITKVLIKSIAAIGCTCSILTHKTNNNFFHVNATDAQPYSVPERGPAWDYNWDGKEPQPLAQASGEGEGEGEGCLPPPLPEEVIRPTAKRNIILVRHGTFSRETDVLTIKGIKQVECTGLYLNGLIDFSESKLYTSTSSRALDSAQVLRQEIPDLQIHYDSDLREGVPTHPIPSSRSSNTALTKVESDKKRIDEAFNTYFYRADPEQTKDSFDIIVGHSNQLRYLVCRALQLPLDAWIRFSLIQGSITWLVIYPDGRVILKCLSEAAYMPMKCFSRFKNQ